MKKRLSLLILVLIFALALTACGCKHENLKETNCESPKICADCDKVVGEAPGHAWVDATCETAKTCENCGRVEGTALGHSWLDATTEAPKTCENCGLTEGERIITDERFTTAATADIQGTWGYTVEMSGDMIGEPDFEGTISFTLAMDLKNDGTMEMYIIMGDISDLRDYMIDIVYKEFEAEGMDKEAADAAMMESMGMTTEEYVDYALEMIDFSSLMGSFSFNGVYYVENGVFYSGMSWNAEMSGVEFVLEGDTLTMMTDLMDVGSDTTVMKRMPEEG